MLRPIMLLPPQISVFQVLRWSLPAGFLLGVLCFFSVTAAYATNGQQVIAEVNGVRLSFVEVDREILQQLKINVEDLPEKERHEVRRAVLRRVIERKLLLQAAREHAFHASKSEFHKFFAETKAEFESNEAFLQQLSAVGLDERSFADGIRDDLTIHGFLSEVVFKNIKIQDAEILAVYARDKGKYLAQEEVKARNIFFKLTESHDRKEKEEEVLRRLTEVHELLSRPRADFQQLARKYSEAPNASSGGDLGYFTRNQMPEEFATPVFALSPGQMSEPIRTANGFHIVLLEDRRGGDIPELDEIREMIHSNLLKEAQQKALDAYVRKLYQKGKIIVYLD